MTHAERMLGVMNALSRLTGLHIVWKDASGAGAEGLPEGVFTHCNPFCQAVKGCPGMTEKCCQDDTYGAAQRALRERRPFYKGCHAGVTELVVPLFDGGRFDGLLFLGPVRLDEAACPYPAAGERFEELPHLDQAVFDAAETLLAVLAGELASHKVMPRLAEAEHERLDPRIARAVGIIQRDLHQPLRATKLAKACCLSTSRFIHLFKQSLGISYSAYVAQARVDRAKSLLTHTELGMGSIAEETGFPNQNYFATVFRRHCGCSPTSYRQSTRIGDTP